MGLFVGRRQILGGALATTLGASACRPAMTGGKGEGGRTKIVVVGAGLAGLVVARELVAKGHEVSLLEAQSRAGGRILTLREPLAEGLYVEAGAKHVVPDPDLLALFASAKVEVAKPKRPEPLRRVKHVHGARAIVDAGAEPDDDLDLTDSERKLGFRERLQHYLPPGAIHGADWLRPQLAGYDAISIREFLKKQGASPGYVRMIESSIVPGDPDQASALSVMREMASIVRELGLPPNGGRVVGGTDKLPEALAKELGERVLYEAEVKRIEQKADRVRILFVRKGRFHAADADRVVVAIPYSVLRDVEITPALSPKKQKAIREMKLVSVSRVWLQSSNRYWNLRGESGDADSDLLVGDVKDETAMLPGPKGVLSAYLLNAKAREMCARIPPERVMAALSDFEKIHPGMGDHLSVGLVKCWDEEPFAKGAYPWFAVGQMTEFGTALYAPEGRLHFAGDHTSNRPGFMHGAVESAKRAVAEVLAALRPKPTSVTDERQRA